MMSDHIVARFGRPTGTFGVPHAERLVTGNLSLRLEGLDLEKGDQGRGRNAVADRRTPQLLHLELGSDTRC